MTTAHRWLLLPVLAVALFLSGTANARADFAASRQLPTMAIATLKVAAPASVSTTGTYCYTTYDSTTGTYSSTLAATISWPATTTARGVTGYVITAYLSDGSKYPVGTTDASTTSVTGSYDAYYATQNIRISVTTQTSYGWTAESVLSRALTC